MQLHLIDSPRREYDDLADGFGHWLAGFIDGEGCFSIGRKRFANYVSFAPSFKLVVRADDADVLHEIVERTGLGLVMQLAVREDASAGNAKPQAGWSVHRRGDCQGLVELLNRYPLRAKKRRDFAIWRQAVSLWTGRNWHSGWARSGPQDWSGLEALADELKAVKRWQN